MFSSDFLYCYLKFNHLLRRYIISTVRENHSLLASPVLLAMRYSIIFMMRVLHGERSVSRIVGDA